MKTVAGGSSDLDDSPLQSLGEDVGRALWALSSSIRRFGDSVATAEWTRQTNEGVSVGGGRDKTTGDVTSLR